MEQQKLRLRYVSRVFRRWPLKGHAYRWLGLDEYWKRLNDSIMKTRIVEKQKLSDPKATALFRDFWNEIELSPSVAGARLEDLLHEATHAVHDYYSGSKWISDNEYELVRHIAQSVVWETRPAKIPGRTKPLRGSSVLDYLTAMEMDIEAIRDPASDHGKKLMAQARTEWIFAKTAMKAMYWKTPAGRVTKKELLFAEKYLGLKAGLVDPTGLHIRYSNLKTLWQEVTKK